MQQATTATQADVFRASSDFERAIATQGDAAAQRHLAAGRSITATPSVLAC